MWIVAIGWMYVVTLMAATEPTVVAGIMTFFGYGVLPLSLVLYLMGAGRRRRRRAERSAQADGAHGVRTLRPPDDAPPTP